MKYNEPLLVKLSPIDYCVYEDPSEIVIHDDVPRDPRFDGQHEMELSENDPRYGKACGGRFNWALLQWPENHEEDINAKLQLMRLWATTMYTQLASDLSYSNEVDTNIKVGLTEEELDVLAKINNKITNGIFNEMWDLNNSFMRKKIIKKVEL